MVDSESGSEDEVAEALTKLPAVEELYYVTGESDMVAVVRVEGTDELRDLLKNILQMKGVRSSMTSVVYDTRKGPRKKAEPTAVQIDSQ